MLSDVGKLYLNRGKSKEALSYLNQALDIFKELFGEEHPETSAIYEYIGSVYQFKKDYENALKNVNKALDLNKKILGDNHPDISYIYNKIGLIYKEMKEYDKALEYLNLALKLNTDAVGEYHPLNAILYNNFSLIYEDLGNLKSAIQSIQKQIDINEGIDPEGWDLAVSYSNMAKLLNQDQQYERAIEYGKKAIDSLEKLDKYTTVSYFDAIDNVAESFNNLHNTDLSIEYYTKGYEHALKDENISYQIFYLERLGEIYKETANWSRRIEALEKAIELSKILDRQDPVSLASDFSAIADSYKSLGEYDKALENNLNAFEIRKELYDDSNDAYIENYYYIGENYYLLENWEKAIEIISDVSETLKSLKGINNQFFLNTLEYLGTAHSNLGDYIQALYYFMEALKISREFDAQFYVFKYLGLIGKVHIELKNNEEALKYFLESHELCSSLYVKNCQEYIDTLEQLGLCLYNLDRSDEALKYIEEAYNIGVEAELPDLQAYYLNQLGYIFYDLEDFATAKQKFEASIKLLPEDHPTALDSQNMLDEIS